MSRQTTAVEFLEIRRSLFVRRLLQLSRSRPIRENFTIFVACDIIIIYYDERPREDGGTFVLFTPRLRPPDLRAPARFYQ